MKFLIFLLVLLLPVQVFAGHDVYIKGNVGIFMLSDSALNFERDYYGDDADIGNIISNTGLGLSAAIGKSSGNFDFELEFAYREADLYNFEGKVFNLDGEDFIFPNKDLNGSLEMKTLMANVIYNFDNTTIITPYLGAGLGAAWIDVDIFDDTQFAYQFLAGLEAAVFENTSILFGYRYLGVRDIEEETTRGMEGHGYYSGEDSATIDSHNLELGLKYSF